MVDAPRNFKGILGRALGRLAEPYRGYDVRLISSSMPLPPEAKRVGQPYELDNGVAVEVGDVDGKGLYYIAEPHLDEAEVELYRRIMFHLQFEMPFRITVHGRRLTPEELAVRVEDAARKVAETYGATFQTLYRLTVEKIIYYVKRDIVGYGAIDAIFHDPGIEDVKVAAYSTPFIVFHRDHAQYDWLETNIVVSPEDQDVLAQKLAHIGGKTVSTAFPLCEVTLPGGHRLAVAFGREVTPKGTSIEVRRFRSEPFTIIHLLEFNTMSPLMAAYMWEVLESKGSSLIIGETGSGKTCTTSALAVMMPPSWSIVTIEDIGELNLPHEHWTSLVTRYSYRVEEGGAGEIDQFQLLRASLRIRPDFIIIGECIGPEAAVLFQSIAVGQGALTTFHALDVQRAFQRLTQPPISVSPNLTSVLDCALVIRKIKPEPSSFDTTETGAMFRRVTSIEEVASPMTTGTLFQWEPRSDSFHPASVSDVVSNSVVLAKVCERRGWTRDEMLSRLEDKLRFLIELKDRGVREFAEVTEALRRYYAGKFTLAVTHPVETATPPEASRVESLLRELERV